MSYNIRLDHKGDGDNAWPVRKEATIAMLEDVKPDVFGVQEALPHQVAYITEQAPNYKNVGVGRDDGVAKGEFMSIFWNVETMEMLEWGTYWLSETPDVPSYGWDAACTIIFAYFSKCRFNVSHTLSTSSSVKSEYKGRVTSLTYWAYALGKSSILKPIFL